MSEFTPKKFLIEKERPRLNPLGELANEVQRLRDEYKKHPSQAKWVLLNAKRKKLAKKGIRIGI